MPFLVYHACWISVNFPIGQSTPTLDLDGNGNVTYEKLLNSTDHATSGSIVTSLKPYYDGYQIFGVIEKSTMICTSVQFEIWYLGDRAFERNSTSCTALSQDDVITFKAQTMAILYFEAQERFLRNLQIYYFSSGTGKFYEQFYLLIKSFSTALESPKY